MQAVILAGGVGTRMRPLTDTLPKPLIKVGDRALIDHIGAALPEVIDEVIIVTHYLADQIKAHCGDVWLGRKVTYAHQDDPKGTGHALFAAKEYIKGKFLLLAADDIYGARALKEAVQYDLAVVVARSDHPELFGVVNLDEKGNVMAIEEKPEHPKSNLVNTSTMVLDERIFSYPLEMSSLGEYLLTDNVTRMIRDHAVKAVEQDIWIPVGYPEDIPRAEKAIADLRPY